MSADQSFRCGPTAWFEARKCCPDCTHPEKDPCDGCGHVAGPYSAEEQSQIEALKLAADGGGSWSNVRISSVADVARIVPVLLTALAGEDLGASLTALVQAYLHLAAEHTPEAYRLTAVLSLTGAANYLAERFDLDPEAPTVDPIDDRTH